ncbi:MULTISPECIES: kinase [Romboutsia]|uniref:Kae1-associated kinase Bud32 n=1 Tax=Romboutsia hominis TaxID=1507512 RepID=A0A2P2BRR6_9FIRM|nr:MULTISPECIES: kinase [Romboutsia]MDB8805142.1 kinase [Romboutsia sp. 1001216sp1]MDB8808882.1 kinase [Romboutsia sp. 1001216sp1]MDB8810787.1 kinase [Romboutsia sp. 1001216sp1]MDB8816507.1 kinase [Romboutsia sp. 1001216sp1]MDB8820107.1 kinase [Romboutsia sp. 1001216sp1]
MVTFDINGAVVEFDEKMDNYNKIRRLFKLYAIEVSESFYNEGIKHIQNINNLQGYCKNDGFKHIEEGLKKAIETIISFDVITIDIDVFKKSYCEKYLNYERMCNNLFKGKGKRNNFKNNEAKSTLESLSHHLYNDCFNIHMAVVDALVENKVDNIGFFIDEESKQKSNALFNNYKDGFITRLDEAQIVKQIIHLNPYREEVYKFLIKEDGDFNKEIERLTIYLGYDISDYKDYLMDNYVKKLLKEHSYNLEIDKEKIEKYAKYVGCTNSSIYTARIDAIYTFENA